MSQFTATSYEVPRASGICAATGRTLEPGEACFAALVETSDAETDDARQTHHPAKNKTNSKDNGQAAAGNLGLRRLDISQAAWEDGYRPERLFSYWKTTVPEPNQKKRTFVDDAVLMNLLRRLADTQQPRRLAFRYVLALILMRKKLLRYDGSTTKTAVVAGESVEQTWWLVTPKRDPSRGPMGKWHEMETMEVLNPQLGGDQIEQVTQQLGEILEAEL